MGDLRNYERGRNMSRGSTSVRAAGKACGLRVIKAACQVNIQHIWSYPKAEVCSLRAAKVLPQQIRGRGVVL
ncbi:hypothetical protein E2C01_081909 [Portunus trituberculatus]|uniref:Uncharacterized protein n=1 Tax=Portunus trituberculatus TaxID=210409 RepID=A0A5B7IXQ6_PORTR|nr:hypothetical protein [Portunus trituberculatus]